jgi:predicted dehydrogenase
MESANTKPTAFVIGAGRMGRQHISNSRKAGLHVTGVFDQNIDSLATAQKDHEVESKYLFSDFKNLCESGVPDLAVIATTTPSHCDFGIQLAKHGVKFLMIEKPLGPSIEQCEELIEQCNRSGTRVAVNYMFRFLPIVQEVKRLLTSDLFGGFTSLAVNSINTGIAMMGSHCIDLLEFFSESSSEKVSAWLKDSDVANPRGRQYSDSGGLTIVHTEKGQRLMMDFPIDQGQGREMLACGRYGMIRFDLDNASLKGVARNETDRALPFTRSDLKSLEIQTDLEKTDYPMASVEHIRNLLCGDAIVTAEYASRLVSVLVAAHHSSDQKNSSVQVEDMGKFKSRTFSWA